MCTFRSCEYTRVVAHICRIWMSPSTSTGAPDRGNGGQRRQRLVDRTELGNPINPADRRTYSFTRCFVRAWCAAPATAFAYFHCPGDEDACNGRAGPGGLGCLSLFHLAPAVFILVVFFCTKSKAGLNAEPIPTLPYILSVHVVNLMSYIQRNFVPGDLPGCIWLGKLFRSGTSMKMCPPFN